MFMNKGGGISTFSFPAATTTVIPARVKAATALFMAVDFGPPRDMLMTAFPAIPFAATSSRTFH